MWVLSQFIPGFPDYGHYSVKVFFIGYANIQMCSGPHIGGITGHPNFTVGDNMKDTNKVSEKSTPEVNCFDRTNYSGGLNYITYIVLILNNVAFILSYTYW